MREKPVLPEPVIEEKPPKEEIQEEETKKKNKDKKKKDKKDKKDKKKKKKGEESEEEKEEIIEIIIPPDEYDVELSACFTMTMNNGHVVKFLPNGDVMQQKLQSKNENLLLPKD